MESRMRNLFAERPNRFHSHSESPRTSPGAHYAVTIACPDRRAPRHVRHAASATPVPARSTGVHLAPDAHTALKPSCRSPSHRIHLFVWTGETCRKNRRLPTSPNTILSAKLPTLWRRPSKLAPQTRSNSSVPISSRLDTKRSPHPSCRCRPHLIRALACATRSHAPRPDPPVCCQANTSSPRYPWR